MVNNQAEEDEMDGSCSTNGEKEEEQEEEERV
jgi:hypothetical protein